MLWESPVVWYRPKVEVPLAATEMGQLLSRAYGPVMVSPLGAPVPEVRVSQNLARASVTRHLVPSGLGPHPGPGVAESAEGPRIVPGCRAFSSVGRVQRAPAAQYSPHRYPHLTGGEHRRRHPERRGPNAAL